MAKTNMNDKEFKAAMKILTDLRGALRRYNAFRKKYPAGIEMLLKPPQIRAMLQVEIAIEKEMRPT